MYPETARHRQGGWLMPLAAFIIVVMALLALAMGRIGAQTSVAGAQEQITVQTFYAAESGAQYAMNRVFYDTATAVSRGTAGNACAAIDGRSMALSAPGMLNCQVNLNCTETVDAADTTSFFDIDSAARCGTAPLWASRTVRISAYIQ